MEKRGFSLLEILIALVILSSAVAAGAAAYHQYLRVREKQRGYEMVYEAILSLKAKLKAEGLDRDGVQEGFYGEVPYTIRSKKVCEMRNYVHDIEGGKVGNKGPFIVSLHRVEITLAGKTFHFFVTSYRREEQ